MRRFFAACLLMGSMWSAGFAAEPAKIPNAETAGDAAAKTDIVELPRFVVSDARELPAPEKWTYAEVAGLEVLSTISETNTRRFAHNFQMMQRILEVVWPALSKGAPGSSTTLILCADRDVYGTFVPTTQTEGVGRATSLFLQDKERAAIVVDYTGDRIDDRFAAPSGPVSLDADPDPNATPPGLAGGTKENDPFREFYQQYYRFVLRRSGGFVPVWLEEGLVQLLASVDYTRRSVAIGRLTDGAGGQRSEEFHVQLSRRPLLEFEQLFARERPASVDGTVYSAQCYAFVHLCLFGKRGSYQAALGKLMQRAAAGPITETAFKECFGIGYKEMEVQLLAHVTYAAHQFVEYKADRDAAGFVEPPPVTMREATQSEVGRIKGETYQMAGHAERARSALIAPYIRGGREPRLLAALGLHEHVRGNDARALPLLEAAIRANVQQPRARLELSRMRFVEAKAALPAGGRLSREQTQAVMGPLIVASQQSPALPEVFELMGETWALSGLVPSTTDLGRIYGGVQRFPQRLRLVYLAAALAVQHDRKSARALIDHGITVAGKTESARHFKALEAQLR